MSKNFKERDYVVEVGNNINGALLSVVQIYKATSVSFQASFLPKNNKQLPYNKSIISFAIW